MHVVAAGCLRTRAYREQQASDVIQPGNPALDFIQVARVCAGEVRAIKPLDLPEPEGFDKPEGSCLRARFRPP
jgi:hypothetical protein